MLNLQVAIILIVFRSHLSPSNWVCLYHHIQEAVDEEEGGREKAAKTKNLDN